MNLLAATFGWLCVETPPLLLVLVKRQVAATFGWLCVETWAGGAALVAGGSSHLRVAVC